MSDILGALLLALAAIFLGGKHILNRKESKLKDKNKVLVDEEIEINKALKEMKQNLDKIKQNQDNKTIEENLDFWNKKQND